MRDSPETVVLTRLLLLLRTSKLNSLFLTSTTTLPPESTPRETMRLATLVRILS